MGKILVYINFIMSAAQIPAGGTEPTTPLWQVQVTGVASEAFTYQIVTWAREALAKHPDPKLRTLAGWELERRLRLISGGPPKSGPADVDCVGIQHWQPVLYTAGQAPTTALEFIALVLDYKLQKCIFTAMPRMLVQCPDGALPSPVPSPWETHAGHEFNQIPSPFAVYPPRGRRHLLAELGRTGCKGDSGSSGNKYMFIIFGGIYPFRHRFEERRIASVQLQPDEASIAANLSPVSGYYVQFTGLEDGKAVLATILQDCLQDIPVFFTSLAQPSDEVAAWLVQQASVVNIQI